MYFGTNGVRGRFDTLGPELALKIAQAVGRYFKGKMIVARDCRLTGGVLKSAVIAGLASVGCDVVDLGIVSAPTAEFMIKKLKAKGCIIVTASHNPPEWNALKVVDGDGVAVSKERGEEIEKLMEGKPVAWDKVGRITRNEAATREHINAIKEIVGDVEKSKIVLDCGNGTASVIAPALFKELGAEIVTLNSHLDGRFPGRPSEPTEENVKELITAVRSTKADAGIAWDADGDRVIFVDENGGYVIGDKVFALSIIWNAKKGDVVTTVATSKAVEDISENVRYTAIGAPYLCEELRKKPAVIGGEEVGGVIWPQLSLAKDGFMTGAMLMKALGEKRLSEWLEQVPEYHNVKKKVKADEKQKKEFVKRVLDYAKKEKLDYNDIDGVRIDFKDSWVIVRASGTENYVRIFAEARSKGKAEELVNTYEKIAKSA